MCVFERIYLFLSIIIDHAYRAGTANLFNIPFLTRGGGLLSYSKFAKNVEFGIHVPSRFGMLCLYFPAFLYAASRLDKTSGRSHTIATMVAVHFLKRSLECLFVHKYSGSMPIASSAFISFFYTLLAFACTYFTEKIPSSEFEDFTGIWGWRLFLIGILGNGYHHYLLASLRKPGEKGYKIPTGGIFGFVATPHYFFELIGWYGVSIASQHSMVLLFSFAMSVYLFDRAVAQSAWNKKKIPGYPKSRKNIIPFVF